MASKKRRAKKKTAKRASRSTSSARWPRRAGKRFTGSASDPLYQRAFAAAMRAAGGGLKALPAPAGAPPNVITVYAEPSPEGSSMPRPRKKAGRRYAGRVSNPLYQAALRDAAKVLKRKPKKKKRRGKKKKPSAAQLRARKAFAARAKARSKTRSKPSRSKTSRKPRAAASRRPTRSPSRKRRASKKPLSAAAQVALRAARGLPTKSQSRAIGTQRWLCGGPRRSGCGSTGRVVTGRGSFRRMR